jgi:hypothetical protein
MGMSLDAKICVGAIVQSANFNKNNNIVSEEILEEKYEGMLSEYLYEILENDGMSVDYPVYSDVFSDNTLLVYLNDTDSNAYYDAEKADISVLTQENIDILKEKLNKHNIKYEDIGIYLYTTYS